MPLIVFQWNFRSKHYIQNVKHCTMTKFTLLKHFFPNQVWSHRNFIEHACVCCSTTLLYSITRKTFIKLLNFFHKKRLKLAISFYLFFSIFKYHLLAIFFRRIKVQKLSCFILYSAYNYYVYTLFNVDCIVYNLNLSLKKKIYVIKKICHDCFSPLSLSVGSSCILSKDFSKQFWNFFHIRINIGSCSFANYYHILQSKVSFIRFKFHFNK